MKHRLSISPVMAWLLMLAVWMGCAALAVADTPPLETRKKIEFTPPAENPDELFKEAEAASEKNPDEAIRLYQRALQSKPGAWEERKKLALLYEKLGRLDAAATEYEAIHKAEDSAESHGILTRILDKTGNLLAAADIAFRGAEKFPDDGALALQAGDLLLRSGQAARAEEFLNRRVQGKSGDNKLFYLLGRSLEHQGRRAAALRAYLRSYGADHGDEYQKALQSLAAYAVRVEELWVFPPQGWEKDGTMIFNATENRRIYIHAHPKGDMKAIALKVIRENMPAGLFDDDQMKSYEEMRKWTLELSKSSPDASAQLMTGRLPVFTQKELTPPMKGVMALASSSEEPSDLMQSVCVWIIPGQDKIYSVALVSSALPQDGEGILVSLTDHIVLP
ncbi:MAG: tetratricopeptide repeat protein [Desulfobacula sp.]|nr:tetratricopeptide repeat protein [Desulfobacula sp.]